MLKYKQMIGRTFRYESKTIGWRKWLWRLIRHRGSQRRELIHKMRKALKKTVFVPPLERHTAENVICRAEEQYFGPPPRNKPRTD